MPKRELQYLESVTVVGSEPTNMHRASWAGEVLVKFAEMTSTRGSAQELHADPDSVVTDLLCDLMHWCRFNKLDFAAALRSAFNTHYSAEATDAAVRTLERSLRTLFIDMSKVRSLIDAANNVAANWESGDLAGAVNELTAAADDAKQLVADKPRNGFSKEFYKHPDTDEHRAACAPCMREHDSKRED